MDSTAVSECTVPDGRVKVSSGMIWRQHITMVPQRICSLKRRCPRWQVMRTSERPLVEAHREFFGCQIRKYTKEAEQHHLTKYYWSGQHGMWEKLTHNSREKFGRGEKSACGWRSTSSWKSLSNDGVQLTNVHYICVQSFVILMLRTPIWQMTKLCPIL